VLVIGAEVARQCVEHGLVDELVIHLVPILLGGGVRLFEGLGPVRLERLEFAESGEITDLRFQFGA
jgi:riboflavin biosynthesis pyrimidine reductase